jgi:5-(aminomethyl)-3-furanmethanol phosphate kinase
MNAVKSEQRPPEHPGEMMAVLKVGGSLSHSPALPDLCREISHLGDHHRLLIVPGGGEFADLVRDFYARLQLSETAAHRMATLAMDQYGYLLGDLIPGAALVADLPAVAQVVPGGRVPVLLPARLMEQLDPLPHSWQVTSDSIAAWVVGALRATLLVLLKDVDGLFSSPHDSAAFGGMLPQMEIAQLPTLTGGVDPYLGRVLAQYEVDTWVINGQHPHRLAELIETGRTIGTYIRGSQSGLVKR